MLRDYFNKVKSIADDIERNDLYVAALIFLVGLASFGLGRLSALWPKKEPITITENQESRIKNQGTSNLEEANISAANPALPAVKGKYIASKNGGS